MRKLTILSVSFAGLVFSVVTAVQIVGQIVRSRNCVKDPRWQEAVTAYKVARERNAPEVELERTKRELGKVFKQLQLERA